MANSLPSIVPASGPAAQTRCAAEAPVVYANEFCGTILEGDRAWGDFRFKNRGRAHEFETLVAREHRGSRRGRGPRIRDPRRAAVRNLPADGIDLAQGHAAADVDLLGRLSGVRALLRTDLREGLRERQAGARPGVALRLLRRRNAVGDGELRLVCAPADPPRPRVLLVPRDPRGVRRGGRGGGLGIPGLGMKTLRGAGLVGLGTPLALCALAQPTPAQAPPPRILPGAVRNKTTHL